MASDELEKNIGIPFKNKDLLTEALTSRLDTGSGDAPAEAVSSPAVSSSVSPEGLQTEPVLGSETAADSPSAADPDSITS